MFEHRSKPLLPRRQFYVRLARSAAVALLVVIVALSIGMAGYRTFEPMSWVDAFVNAAMILSGMGPVSSLQTDGVIFAPVFHRFLHKFHLEETKRDGKTGG